MNQNLLSVRHQVVEDFMVQEGIKTLRSNLMFSGMDKRIFGITSCNASEGKSTVCFQLASSFAQLDKKVLLLDVDLRKSSISRRFGFAETDMGVTHYLSGLAQATEIIYHTDIPGLDVAYAGKLVLNASELLASRAFKELIMLLREAYDYVIVDTPPLGQVIDCAVIASDLDGVVILIDTTNNSYKMEKRIRNQLEKASGQVLGVVLNKVDVSNKFGYYGKAYGGKYSYE